MVPKVPLRAGSGALALVALAGCAAPPRGGSGRSGVPPTAVRPEPRTARALLAVARRFEAAFDTGHYGPVYARWDARSRAIISRADYLGRHAACPSGPEQAVVEQVLPGPDGAFRVRYSVGGQQLTDVWYYVDGRWVFDLPLSNPAAARLYRLPFPRYAAAIGCRG